MHTIHHLHTLTPITIPLIISFYFTVAVVLFVKEVRPGKYYNFTYFCRQAVSIQFRRVREQVKLCTLGTHGISQLYVSRWCAWQCPSEIQQHCNCSGQAPRVAYHQAHILFFPSLDIIEQVFCKVNSPRLSPLKPHPKKTLKSETCSRQKVTQQIRSDATNW